MFVDRLTKVSDISQLSDWQFHEKHFTSPRLASYLQEFEGNELKAQALYEWNTRTASAFWELISYLEISLRNSIDRRLSETYSTTDKHWLLVFESETLQKNTTYSKELRNARTRISNQGKEFSPERLISELPFGFWASLISKRYRSLWPDLASGFQGLPTRSPSELQSLIQKIRDLRNRIGHHHKIWHLDLQSYHADILQLAAFIDPNLGIWMRARSRLPCLLDERPI